MFKKEISAVLVSAAVLIVSLSACSATETAISASGRNGNYILENGQKLLGNNNYPAISYSGYRKTTRTVKNTPSIEESKEDLKILSAMGIRLIRTYNAREFPHAERTLKAIRELKEADPDFEMYVMLGAWIQ
jgi:hypothetical protein